MRSNHEGTKSFNLCKDQEFMEEILPQDKLVVMTSIQVYQNECIQPDQSGLTIGKILFKLDDQKDKKFITLNYQIKAQPNFSFQPN